MMTRRLSAFGSSRTFRLHVSPHPAFDRMRFLFTMSEIEGRKERRRIRSSSPAIRPSSRQALARSTKLINRIGKDRKRFNLLDTSSRPCGPDLGGARRDRTDDLMLAKHALSQLSYGPVSRPAGARRLVVGLGGLEPPTSRLSSARSNQLSYKPGRRRSPRPLMPVRADSRRKASISLDQKERRRRRDPANAA